MKILKKVLIGFGILVTGILILFFIYYQIYKQQKIATSEINSPDLSKKILIASQGSTFKNALVKRITGALMKKPYYIKIVDATTLSEYNSKDWNKIIILHTTEAYRAPEAVHKFLDNINDLNKVILVATSGDGDWKPDYDIDTITSASKINDINAISEKVLNQI